MVSDLQPRVRAANGGEALQISILENDALNPVIGNAGSEHYRRGIGTAFHEFEEGFGQN